MGLKDWGEGLEELTESYYRYANQRKGETWFVTNGVIGERIKKKRSRKNKSKKGSRSPVEIDLIAFLIDDNYKIKKIHAIQCKEAVKGKKQADKVLVAFDVSTINKLFENATKRGILEKVVAYVEINDTAKKKLKGRVKLLYYLDMMYDLVDMTDKYIEKGRKGYEGEGLVWFLKRLRKDGQILSKKEWDSLMNDLVKDGQVEDDPNARKNNTDKIRGVIKGIAGEKNPKRKLKSSWSAKSKKAKKAARTRKRNAAAKEKKRKAAARRRKSGKKKR